MLRDLYDLERLLELERLGREARMRHERRRLEQHDDTRRPRATPANLAYILTLFRLV